jgi:hypothetical protein
MVGSSSPWGAGAIRAIDDEGCEIVSSTNPIESRTHVSKELRTDTNV